ncbi:MAG TPA: hypothetical protein VIO38_02765, partial [Rariglobus sp.]
MQPSLGRKRRIATVRPQVEAVVGLCGQDVLTTEQTDRLSVLAYELGVRASDANPCAALAAALGDEWATASESAGALTERERRDAQNRAMLTALRRQTIRREFFGAPNPVAAPEPVSTAIWEEILPELRLEIVERLADADPRTVLSLYEANVDARDTIDGARHVMYYADGNGRLARARVPLIDYVRLASAFGETDPIRLFLAAALCTLKAFADRQTAAEGSSADRDVFSASGRDLDLWPWSAYSTAIDRGLRTFRSAGELARLVSAMGESADPREVLEGPLPGDLPDIAVQWRQWSIAPRASLLTPDGRPTLPLVARYVEIFRWPGPSPIVRDLYDRTRLANGIRAGPGAGFAGPRADPIDGIRWLGAVDADFAARLMGLDANDPALQEWLQSADLNVRTDSADRLQGHVNDSEPATK